MQSCIIRSSKIWLKKNNKMRKVINKQHFIKEACSKNGGSTAATNNGPQIALLPDGIERIVDVALVSKRLLPATNQKTVIAAFDFDGTCINTSSPSSLVGVLGRAFQLNLWRLFRVGLWAVAYKFNIPFKDAVAVRRRVFTAFEGESAIDVNNFLRRFYHEKVAPYFREAADAEMIAHLEAGHAVVVVSASFEPIIAAAMVEHPIEFSVSSRMKIDDDGNYTSEVLGLPVEGADKMVVLREFADKYFGVGKWEIGWAYGDHYSDLDMLEAAKHPCAVTPDKKLERVAKERGWTILDWS